MDFGEEDDPMLSGEMIGDIMNQVKDDENPPPAEIIPEPLVENAAEPMNNGDKAVNEPVPTTSTSKSMVGDRLGRTNIQEFIRILRPNLPRKSKSRAYKLLKHIANGIIVQGTYQRRSPKKKAKKRGIRKAAVKRSKPKMRSVTGIRRSAHSMCESTESSISDRYQRPFNNKNKRNKTPCRCCDYSSCRY